MPIKLLCVGYYCSIYIIRQVVPLNKMNY